MLSPLYWQSLRFDTRERAVLIDVEFKILMQETYYYTHPSKSYSFFKVTNAANWKWNCIN
jgi:hypothetical protein